ncbi:hypothetical protein JJB07_09345 [Tumebacillus sp. ITR2]|uniref:DUF1440 domain-containing protein n=1 Tax=Tumebacillus amylolyticus TaxID=2801339 RepID=A0ABS1J9A5_9BACL|nr:hypothetical protein [Tumebacillus amylolyticus]MBL0386856.1 hypothetical protein [Tumebacillus amylolyticus]
MESSSDRSSTSSPSKAFTPRPPRILLAGLASGLFLGVLLVVLRRYTGYPLDAILLDLSYTPVLSDFNTPLLQWAMHLLVAVAVAFVYAKLTRGLTRRSPLYGLLFGALVSAIYFILAPLVAPNLINPFETAPFAIWVGAHLLYGIVLDKLL